MRAGGMILALAALAIGFAAPVQAVPGRSPHHAPTPARPFPSAPPHNVVLVVVDGLRGGIVTPATAPEMARLRDAGTAFPNSHSVFPTFTTANASVLATGHQLGDTGDFSNTIYTAQPMATAAGSVTPFLENDAILGEMNARFGGDYLDETTVLAAARAAGYGTAAIGKLGPALIQDHLARTGATTIILDDTTGRPGGIPLAPDVTAGLAAAGLPATAPPRGANGAAGDHRTPGTLAANVAQQDWFVDATTQVVLPMLKARGRPFAMVFWSRDPDGSQHNQGDSLNRIAPGINGPTSLAGIRNADTDLGRLRAALERLGLTETTDIIVTSDHGFSTISKQSATSPAAKRAYADVPAGFLPPGFLALDLADMLGLRLFDPEAANAAVAAAAHPSRGSALLGTDPLHPDIVVAANGGSDLVYLPDGDRAMAARVVAALLRQDYVSGIFVDDRLGALPGTLPLSAINLKGRAVTPVPAIVVNFRTYTSGCAVPTTCQVEIADTNLQQGQGMHGSLGRGDTLNFTAAIGPDFRARFVDPAPISNVDLGRTMLHLLHLTPAARGTLTGRVLGEAMPGGAMPRTRRGVLASPRPAGGMRTILRYQQIGPVRYLDAAGFAGRTFGLSGDAR